MCICDANLINRPDCFLWIATSRQFFAALMGIQSQSLVLVQQIVSNRILKSSLYLQVKPPSMGHRQEPKEAQIKPGDVVDIDIWQAGTKAIT